MTARAITCRRGAVLGGKYLLLREAGHGAMGAVWVARNLTLDVDVAIKFVSPERGNAHLSARLLEEARATASLRHPSIVQVFDFDEPDGYMVMELLEGESLRSLIERSGWSGVRAVRTLLPVASGMAAAHERGIVHRDLKPDNILLVRDGSGRIQPKVVDFGLAKRICRLDTEGSGAHAAEGTPGYMAPEQVCGEAVDARTDVWAFCSVLYELVAGDTPFPYGSDTNIVFSVLRDEVQPLDGHPNVDDDLWSILKRGLEKEPTDRWASMHELGVALARWLVGHGELEDISGVSVCRWWASGDAGPAAPAAPRASELAPTLDTNGGPLELDRTLERSPRRSRPRGSEPMLLVRPRRSDGAAERPSAWRLTFSAACVALMLVEAYGIVRPDHASATLTVAREWMTIGRAEASAPARPAYETALPAAASPPPR